VKLLMLFSPWLEDQGRSASTRPMSTAAPGLSGPARMNYGDVGVAVVVARARREWRSCTPLAGRHEEPETGTEETHPPDGRILVGCWMPDVDVSSLGSTIKTDAVVTSLREAMKHCIEAASADGVRVLSAEPTPPPIAVVAAA
jgi:hypothetical protein